MKHGMLTLPVLPVRREPSERAEMTTQLLFGEQFEVLETEHDWSLLRNAADGYTGWATSKMLTLLSETQLNALKTFRTVVLSQPLTLFRSDVIGQLQLPAGSVLRWDNLSYLVPHSESFTPLNPDRELLSPNWSVSLPERILQTSLQFLNAPYLWGGKTVLGIDCSGLVQLSAAIHGFQMPRDACDQALLGDEQFLGTALPGDLAFFSNAEGRIVHVGLLADARNIVHASGCVRIDALDERGIYNTALGKYTHQLHSIKRIFPS